MKIKGIEMVHYRRRADEEMPKEQQQALLYLYLMLEDIARAGLPVENVYEQCEHNSWQHIVFPETSQTQFNQALLAAGFEKCLDIQIAEIDPDFRERLYRGETLKTPDVHTGFQLPADRPKRRH